MSQDQSRLGTFGFGQQNILSIEEFGNKAGGLAAISSLGIPVPSGFSLSVSICKEYFSQGGIFSADSKQLLSQGIGFLEQATGNTFAGNRRPLLVSVRSGAPVSMPGIMDTILNVGLTPLSVRGLIAKTGNPRFVYDTYRRFLENFGVCVFGHDAREYQRILRALIERERLADERELNFQSLRTLCEDYTQLYSSKEERQCLTDAMRQLECSAIAVIKSWMNPRASEFRRINHIEESVGTAVTVQAMVFGNMGFSSGAGVAFSRNPWTGVKELITDFRFGAQGEDVVSGARSASTLEELTDRLPDVYRELLQISSRLEEYFRDMQDIEFTVQEGRLFILQNRSGKRSPFAALKINIDLCEEGIIMKEEALRRLNGIDLDAIELQKVQSSDPPISHGIPASDGVVTGSIAFSAERAVEDSMRGNVILVRETASPDDIIGIHASVGILTARGSRTSHAAVVARQMGKVCVVNCTELAIEQGRHRCSIHGFSFHEGDLLSLDGNSGAVYQGKVNIIREKPEDLITLVHQWKQNIT
jgi:pyruvate,orthophosphate dikinase